MRSNNLLNATVKSAALAAVLLASGASYAADIYLQTESLMKELRDSEATLIDTVRMWRFICDPDVTTGNDCVSSTSGSPQINVVAGEALTIVLDNTLLTPVSIMIPGQMETSAGDAFISGDRVQSFTHEALPGGSATYTWSSTSLRVGTYLYQSGTHPSIQVPMGLYGALVVGPATGVGCTAPQVAAYNDLDSCYDNDVVMLFSELDPMQNALAEAAGSTVSSYPSTINYSPSYLLVNGNLSANFEGIGDESGTAPVSRAVLLRLLNAGSRSHTPAIVGLDMSLIAEDGNVYPGNPRIQAQALLPAGKTLDAVVNAPADNVTFALYDRTPEFSNNALPEGGMIANIVANAGSPDSTVVPLALDDTYDVDEDGIHTTYVGDLDPNLAGVLDNDDGSLGNAIVVSTTANGTLLLATDGSFTYTPNTNFSGIDGFTYSATGGGNTYGASVTLRVSFENDTPVAVDDGPYANTNGTTIVVDAARGVLGNDADPDGDALTAVLVSATDPANLTLNDDGSFSYTGAGDASFTYRADDGTVQSDPATATLTYSAPSNIMLTVEDPNGTELTQYRWLVQENATYIVDPDNLSDPVDFTAQQALNFHRSSMPVVAQGCRGCTPDVDNDPTGDFPGPGDIDTNRNGIFDTEIPFEKLALDSGKHYYVSVLPNDAMEGEGGHTIGGAQLAPSQTAVTVVVNRQEIPTAQVAVLVFEDNFPTNGVPDPNEDGVGGFQIKLEDAGGKYGISGGEMSQDAFGIPLTNSLIGTPGCPGAAAPPGVIITCPDGTALIVDLPPGKFGIIVQAPGGEETWTQTSTIEGTKVVDAWVEAGNPPFFAEFGVPSFHAFIGFVNPANTTVDTDIPPGQRSNTITGNVTLFHESRPPEVTGSDTGSYDALSYTRAWVGLNSSAGAGPNITSVQAEPDGSFTLEGIPAGTHQLVIWDSYNDTILHYHTAIVGGPNETVDVGNIAVNAWFARTEHNVFLDDGAGGGIARDGIRNGEEAPLAEQNINLRWRDGTINQAFPTDLEGFVPFDETFPFFHWQVLEVDFTRFEATGMTVTVDAGGDTSGGPYPGLLNPQPQGPCTQDDVDNSWNGCTTVGAPYANPDQRTETGQILTEAWQGFPGQTSIFDWGKVPYEPGTNGGISGIVFYGSTRGEADPRLTAGDPWEPGIANVEVRLYREVATDFEGGTALALVAETTTDSWDASIPDNCPGENGAGDPFVDNTLLLENVTRCYDGWRNWNQARPGVFDGGYAFNDIPAGEYVVEVVVPPGYELIKEQDMNVGFGDSYGPNNTYAATSVILPNGMLVLNVPDQAMIDAAQGPKVGIAQPPCVGLYQDVPGELSLFPGEPTPFAGAQRPLCDRKRVVLSDQHNAAAEFHLFTSTPVAGQFSGLITDDIASETNPAAPGYGEKWSPAYLPFSMRDFTGREVYRGYSDAFGHFNGVLPSSFTANIPIPSGYSPNMVLTCLNDPGDGPTPDKRVNSAYGPACYTLQFMPGTTTYLDTPMLPQAAFAAAFNPVDCACTDGTPVVTQVDGTSFGPLVAPGGTLTIHSQGETQVPNPDFEGPFGPPGVLQHVTRNFDFGGGGTVTLDGTALVCGLWNPDAIECTAPATAGEYQLVVTRGDNGKSSKNAVTVTVGVEDGTVHRVLQADYPATPIQDAIDAATAGDLILVETGTYDELVVLWKPVRLQGSGAATFIDAGKSPNAKLETWRTKVKGLIDAGTVDLLPGQPTEFNLVGGGLFGNELGGGITVLAKNDSSFASTVSRIDGFTISNADGGGAIFVNGYAHDLEIANNTVANNNGVIHGGIRVGHPFLSPAGDGPFAYNTDVNIHHNSITKNGGMSQFGAGGGLSINTGTDGYTVADNFICGNFKLGDGAGLGHFGLSNNGMIASNDILFNQSFNQGVTRSGGGVFIGGEPPATGLSLGAGNVTVDGNLIQGNQAASGHGGGLRAQAVNGRDVAASNQVNNWYQLIATNNMIINNMAAWSGGGISLQDTVNATIVLNTVANNDSTATAGAILDAAGVSTPQPAGISSERNSLALDDAIPGGGRNFSDPALTHNIIWHNRAFYYDSGALVPSLTPTAGFGCPSGANYMDLGVIDPGFKLRPQRSILSSTAGYPGNNSDADPELVSDYCNGARTLSTPGPMQVSPAAGEGGNFVDVRYGPITQIWPLGGDPWDYHISMTSPAIDGNGAQPSAGADHDFDQQSRPAGPRVDWGADEYHPLGTPPPPGPELGTVSYGSGAFGEVPVDSTASLAITATVDGTSPAPVMFTSSSSPTAPFAKTDDSCSGFTVAVGDSCTFTVEYSPTAVGADTDSLTINNNGDGNPHTVNLSGSGVLPGVVEIASASFGSLGGGTLNFGNLPNNPDVSSTVTLSVGESTPVTFGSLALAGNGRFTKSVDSCSGNTVAAGGSCTFTIIFDPQGNGVKNATVSIPHNGLGATSLALTGR